MNSFLKVLAALQAIGGVAGIVLLAHNHGRSALSGELGLWNKLIFCFLLGLFVLATWGGIAFLRRPKSRPMILEVALLLQVISVSFSGFAYEFYSGFKAPFGLVGDKFGIRANIGSNAFLGFPQTAPFSFTINLGALIFLVLFTKATRADQ